MAYIPSDAEWFLAELVEEIRVAGNRRNVVHINFTLIKAQTPNEAYLKSMELGKQSNVKYKNEKGKQVTVKFIGLRNLDVIYEPLEHGCEVIFVERMGMSPKGTHALVRKKKELEAFMPIRSRPGRPDYADGDIMREAVEAIKTKKK